jgi:hypothetical protein
MNDLPSLSALPELARCPSQYAIDEHAFNTAMRTATEPRQRELLQWLYSSNADSYKIIRWMQGIGLALYRQEDPALALISALPSDDSLCEPAIREVLAKRIGEAVICVANDESNNSDWNRLAEDTWIQLFVLMRRLGVSNFKTAVMQLFQRCEREGRTPFDLVSEASRYFTRFVMDAQPNNELEKRWIAMIKGSDDAVLKASLFDAFCGLLSMPREVSILGVNECIVAFKTRIRAAFDDESVRSAKQCELQQLVDEKFPQYADRIRTLLLAEDGDIGTLSDFEQVYRGDQAALAQIYLQEVSSDADKPQQLRAKVRYMELCPQTLPSSVVEFVTDENRRGLVPGDHKCPRESRRGQSTRGLPRKKVKPETLRSYGKQLRATTKG